MRRAPAVVLALALALAAPSAAHAVRTWEPPTQVSASSGSNEWQPQYRADVAVAANGDVVVIWPEVSGTGWNDTQLMRATKPIGGSLSAPTPIGPPGSAEVANLAADSLGNTYYVRGTSAAGPKAFAVRPAGGDFGPEETVDTNHQPPLLLASPDGEVALVWYSGSLRARFRPPGGSFGPIVDLGSVPSDYGYELSGALSTNGDLAVAMTTSYDTTTPPQRVFGFTRSASGEVTKEQLSDGKRYAFRPSVAIDDAGRAIVVWPEQDTPGLAIREVLRSDRPAGGSFGTRRSLVRSEVYGLDVPQVTMRRDGLATVLIYSGHGPRIFTTRPGAGLEHVHSFYQSDSREPTPMASSPSGNRTIVTRRGTWTLAITNAVEGEGPFEPGQDLRRDCGPTHGAEVAIGDGGHGAALTQAGQQLLLTTDYEGDVQRSCIQGSQYNPFVYDTDPYVPPPRGPAGGGTWVPDSEPPDPSVPPQRQPLPVGTPSLTAASKRTVRRARAVVICGKPCSIVASANLHWDRGSSLSKGRVKRGSNGKATAVEIPLTLSSSEAKQVDEVMRKGGKRPLVLTVTVTASGKGMKRRKRVVNVTIGPNGLFI